MTSGVQAGKAPALTASVVMEILSLLPARPFAIQLPDGAIIPPDPPDEPPQFTLILHRPAALRRMLLPPSELAIGESYIFGDVDIVGDIAAAFGFVDQFSWPRPSWRQLARIVSGLLRLERAGQDRPADESDPPGDIAYKPYGRRHSTGRDRRAARFHYDLSNRFFELWLDERLVYSCAMFASPEESLDAAQRRKLDRVCQWLALRPGERLLDIGCGFGGLIIHAASEYGARAVGISLSEEQTREARRRIAHAGLADRCAVEICHYERFQAEQPFDKVASIGMFEHVGEERLSAYLGKVHDVLKPGGAFLLQGGMTRQHRPHAGHRWMERLGLGRNAFMQRYSFPDSRHVSLPATLAAAESAGFEARLVESLRPHYPLTLRHWLSRLERREAAAISEVGEVAYRSWRLVLAGYLHLLQAGKLTEYQLLLDKLPNSSA